MTPCDRLPLILRHGALLSLNERRRRNVAEPAHEHSWGAPGRKEELADYICFAFLPPWGMLKDHGQEFAILAFEAEPVCTIDGALFCPTNSAKSDYTVEEITNMSQVDALNACFPNRDTYQAYPQTEVLIPHEVSLTHLQGIAFCDREAQDYWVPKLREVLASQEHSLPEMHGRRIPTKVGQFNGFRFPADYVVERRVRE